MRRTYRSTSTIPLYAETGRRIREIRKAQGISQQRLAAVVGLSRTSITNIEKGRQKVLLHTLDSIAGALGTGLRDLLPERPSAASKLERQLPKDVSPTLKKLILDMVEKQSVAS